MIKKLYILFKLGRKLAKSDALNIFTKFHKPPIGIKILFYLLSLSFSKKDNSFVNETEGERLSNSLQSMGTTFIKLGQFLATRPDIIGEKLSKQLESLQDRLPPFELSKAKEIINEISKMHNIKKGILMKSLRIAFFGSLSGPDLIQSWELFSESNTDRSRIERCLK